MKKYLVIVFLWMSAILPGLGDTPDFSKYQVILDRKPFGVAPPPEVVQPVFTPENSFAKSLRMCALLEDDNGIRIGLIDQSNNKNFFLSVGQTEENIDALIKERAEAKANKNYAVADAVRDKLDQFGISLQDSRSGTTWGLKLAPLDIERT